MALAYLQSMCSPNPSDVEDPYIQACIDEMLGRPNPFRQPIQEPILGTILNFLRQRPHAYIHTKQKNRQNILDDEEFSL